MRLYLIVITSCLLAVSCKQKEVAHLPQPKMVAILTDLHMAEVYSTMVNDSAGLITNKNTDSLAYYYKTVLAHHNVSLDEFNKSLRWYIENTKELDSTYNKVLTDLSAQEGIFNAQNASQPQQESPLPGSEP